MEIITRSCTLMHATHLLGRTFFRVQSKSPRLGSRQSTRSLHIMYNPTKVIEAAAGRGIVQDGDEAITSIPWR